MKRFFFVALICLLATPWTALAQEEGVLVQESAKPKVADKKFWVLTGTLYGLTALDGKSTFDSFKKCPTCYEGNPLAAPFINAGPVYAYAAGAAMDTGLTYLAWRMKKSESSKLRKTWMILPVAAIVIHGWAAQHNYKAH